LLLGVRRSSFLPSASTRIHASISESEGGHSDAASISDVDSGIENNIGDFGGYESSQSAGIHSPSSVASGSECASINSPQLSANYEFDLDLDLDLGPPLSDFDGYPFGLLSEEQTIPNSLIPEPPAEQNIPSTQEVSSHVNLFSPDEEDVENQLMHIDDQLIRLDDDIENINEGVQRTLDQAIMVQNLGPETIADGLGPDPFQDEDSNVGFETLLGAEEQEFLFSALEHDQTSMFTDSLFAAADGVTEVNPFDDWQADTNRELEDLLGGSIPASDVRPPPPAVTESIVKSEVKEEPEDIDEGTPKAKHQRKVDAEPEKNVSEIKEEQLTDDEEEEDDYDQDEGKSHSLNSSCFTKQ
jgi:hypothetical protein